MTQRFQVVQSGCRRVNKGRWSDKKNSKASLLPTGALRGFLRAT